jgi:hypothetical protein
MRTIGQPFCKVCQETIRNRIRSGAKPSCFVATTVYDDAAHPDVAALREWRDRNVVPGSRGRPAMRTLAAVYERVGPRLAGHVRGRPRVAWVLRRGIFAPLARLLRRRAARRV